MNIFIRLIVRVSILVLGTTFVLYSSPVMAQLQDAGYTCGVQVMNLEGTDSICTRTGYDPHGEPVFTINDTVPGNGSLTYFQDSRIPYGFNRCFDICILCDKQHAAIFNIVTTNFA